MRHPMLGPALLVGALALAASVATAADSLSVGERVRVHYIVEVPGNTAPIRRTLLRTATLAALDTSGLRLHGTWHRDRVSIPLANVERIQITDGRSASRGALRGGSWGGVLALAIGVVGESLFGSTDEHVDGMTYVALAAGGALAGAATGAMLGAETWAEVPVRRLYSQAGGRP